MNGPKRIAYRKCRVKYCGNRNSVHSVLHYFTLPRDPERRAVWIQNCVPELADKNIVFKDFRICQEHFEDKMFLNVNQKNRLTENAVPTLFSDDILAKRLSGDETVDLKREWLDVGALPYITKVQSNYNVLSTSDGETIKSPSPKMTQIDDNVRTHKNLLDDHAYCKRDSLNSNSPFTSDRNNTSNGTRCFDELLPTTDTLPSKPEEVITLPSKPEETSITSTLLKSIFNLFNFINIPSAWFSSISGVENNIVTFHKLGPFRDGFVRSVEKQIVLSSDSRMFLHVYGKEMSFKDIGLPLTFDLKSVYDLEQFIDMFDKIKVCKGSMTCRKNTDLKPLYRSRCLDAFDLWRHSKCIRILNEDSENNVCLWCKSLCAV